jgi:hypothetical protein
VNLDELDRGTLQAHLTLHGWSPMYCALPKGGAHVVLTNGDRWFLTDDRAGSFAVQTGKFTPGIEINNAHEKYWDNFTTDKLREIVAAMLSYGELYG